AYAGREANYSAETAFQDHYGRCAAPNITRQTVATRKQRCRNSEIQFTDPQSVREKEGAKGNKAVKERCPEEDSIKKTAQRKEEVETEAGIVDNHN
ncbi:MAG TPA: hypothetical protein VGD31_18890, partial [Sphingobacteriaceae bacterium]